MPPTQNPPSPGENPEETRLDDPLDDYLLVKSKANETGNYRRNAERVLNEFLDWAEEQGIETFDALDVADLEAYALSLNRRTVGENGIAATTARKYYDYVRAYLSWCASREYAYENPAEKDRAEEALPDDDEPNLSRLSRDRKERLRLLLDVDSAGVAVYSVELGRAVDLDDDWALVHQSIRATTDDVEKRKEIDRSKRATHERIENGYDHGRPPFGLTSDDSGHYWIPDRDTDEYRAALACIRLHENGHSWRETTRETSVNRDTARRIYVRRERHLPDNERVDAAPSCTAAKTR